MTGHSPDSAEDPAQSQNPLQETAPSHKNIGHTSDHSPEHTQKRLEQTLENLRIHQEELRVQNDDLLKIQEELEESHSKYRELFESAPIGYVILNNLGHVEEINLTGCHLLGHEHDHVLRTNIATYIHPESRQSFDKHLSQIFLGALRASVEIQFFHPTKQPLHVSLESVPIRDFQERVVSCRTAVIDITERKHLESQVRYAQKLESLGVLAGGIAHDVNNLLGIISSHAGLALNEVPDYSVQHDRLKTIEKAALRGGELAHQLLSYAGRSKATFRTINLTSLIRDMSHLLQVAIAQKGTLQYELVEDLPPINADPSQMRQILLNLTTNASEALEGQVGVIRICTKIMSVTPDLLKQCVLVGDIVPGEAVCLEIVDSGSGIRQRDLPKIFDPFFTTKFTGRGLGLAALLGIIRTHGGAITVISTRGQGTSFRMVFPIDTSQQTERETESSVFSEPDTEEMEGKIILIIDDEEGICIAARLILEQAGFQVLLASDGRDGLRIFHQHRDELAGVLLDLTMPNINGEKVFRAIRTHSQDLPVIVSSGHSEEEARKRLSSTDFHFIQKPYVISILPRTFKKMIFN